MSVYRLRNFTHTPNIPLQSLLTAWSGMLGRSPAVLQRELSAAGVWWLPYGNTLAGSCEAVCEAADLTLALATTVEHALPPSAWYQVRVWCGHTLTPIPRGGVCDNRTSSFVQQCRFRIFNLEVSMVQGSQLAAHARVQEEVRADAQRQLAQAGVNGVGSLFGDPLADPLVPRCCSLLAQCSVLELLCPVACRDYRQAYLPPRMLSECRMLSEWNINRWHSLGICVGHLQLFLSKNRLLPRSIDMRMVHMC